MVDFAVGVRGSIKTDDFDSRLAGLGVNKKKVKEVIATIRKTLELSDVMLKIYHMAIRTKPEWVKQSLSKKLANASR